MWVHTAWLMCRSIRVRVGPNQEGDSWSAGSRGALTILIVKHTGSTDAGGSVGWRGGRYPMIGNDPCCQPIIPGDPDPAMGAVAKDVA